MNIETNPSLLKAQQCKSIYDTIVEQSPNLLGTSIDLDSKIPLRIIVEDKFLKTKSDASIKGAVIGKRTLELITFEHISHINNLNMLPIWQNTQQILKMFNNNELEELQKSIEACSGESLNLMEVS